jgi:tRNA(His) 5'-end guanylyltransferase
LASSYFSSISDRIFGKNKLATFDCRAFIVPKEDVANILWWRQTDAIRNSIQSLARALYSHKECNNKNVQAMKEMIKEKGQDWDRLPLSLQRGRAIFRQIYLKDSAVRGRWVVDNNIPLLYQEPNYIIQHLSPSKEKQNESSSKD